VEKPKAPSTNYFADDQCTVQKVEGAALFHPTIFDAATFDL